MQIVKSLQESDNIVEVCSDDIDCIELVAGQVDVPANDVPPAPSAELSVMADQGSSLVVSVDG